MNLKPYFDAVQGAQAEVVRVANEIDAQFNLGSEEGKQAALSMKAQLDEAQAKVGEAQALYDSMKAAAATGEAAAKFAPAAGSGKAEAKKQLTRAEYEALPFADRHAFFKDGGEIVEE